MLLCQIIRVYILKHTLCVITYTMLYHFCKKFFLLEDKFQCIILIFLTYLYNSSCFLEKLLCKLILIYFTYVNVMKIIHIIKGMVKKFYTVRKKNSSKILNYFVITSISFSFKNLPIIMSWFKTFYELNIYFRTITRFIANLSPSANMSSIIFIQGTGFNNERHCMAGQLANRAYSAC